MTVATGRRLARQCAVQALYQWRLTGQDASEIRDGFIANEKLKGKHLAYFSSLIERIPDCVEEIDEKIAAHLDRDAARVDLIEQAILRLAAFELMHVADVPTNAVLDEAVELAKIFCAENGYRYVNGVLDKIARDVRDEPKT